MQLADRAEQADRAEHGGEAEQQRQAGGDERAERDQQDDQRDREREELGPLEVLLERLADLLLGRRVAELADGDLGMGALDLRDGVERALDDVLGRVLVTGEVEVDHRRAAVVGDVAGELAS